MFTFFFLTFRVVWSITCYTLVCNGKSPASSIPNGPASDLESFLLVLESPQPFSIERLGLYVFGTCLYYLQN